MDDRISDLPEAILCHILSFLPTKQAVATSVLSKRWKPLWRFVPTLDFDSANHIRRFDGDCDYYARRKDRFVRSVSAVLLLRDWHRPIQKFCLRCSSSDCDPTDARIWIHAALQRRVEHLHLSLSPYWHCSIINCSNLVVLKLENLYLELPSSLHFSSLKILHMKNLGISDHLCFSKFLNECPILEDLKINYLWFKLGGIYNSKIIPIINCSTLVVLKLEDVYVEPPSSPYFPSLRILHMENCSVTGHLPLSKFLSACPILEDLKIIGLLVNKHLENLKTTGGLHPLAEKEFEILYPLAEQEFEILPKLIRASIGRDHVFLVRAVTNTKFLQIIQLDEDEVKEDEMDENERDYIEGINRFYKDCVPVFHNLIHMELNYRNYCTGIKVIELLQSCPKLQVIVINKGFSRLYPQEGRNWSKQSIPGCISLHLMTCHLNNYQDLEDEFQFANYIMQNAKLLQTMTISCSSIVSQPEKFKIHQRISTCTRCSTTCKLSFE